jgi:gamma-glutamyltranspeptidase/glutathione hydrolase
MNTQKLFTIAACALLAVSAHANEEFTTAHGMVVVTTGTPAAAAGIEALKHGGTAMDAALTAAMLQPCLAAGSYVSYAGILNVVYFDAASGRVYNLSAGFNTVKGETDPLSIPGIATADLLSKNLRAFHSTASGRTALVPGFLAGVEAAHRRFGKRPFAELVQPAIRCAVQGFPLSKELAGMMASRREVLERLTDTKAIFNVDGELPRANQVFRQPALAATLREISRQGPSAYIYRGAWARAFVEAVQQEGGKMALEDLATYQPTWIEPVHGMYNGFDVYAHGLPSSGGLGLIEGLNLATAAQLSHMPPYRDSPLALYWTLQFAKLSSILSAPGVAPQFGKAYGLDLTPESRLTPETAAKLWEFVRTGRIPSVPKPTYPAHSDAVVAVDAQGNVAALVHSINTVLWGSTGIFVGGISIPDSAAFQQAAIAAIAPGSRLPDSTSPGIALKNGKPVLGFSAIGEGVPTRTLAALVDTLGHGMTPRQAIASPSLGGFDYSKASAGVIGITVGAGEFSDEYLTELRRLGQPVAVDDDQRGYWIGVAIDGEQRRAGALRELSIAALPQGY